MTGMDSGCSQNEFDMSNRLVRVAVTSSGAVDISGHMDLSREIYVYTADNKRVTTVRPNGNNNQVFYIYGAKNELGMVCSSQFFGNAPVCETGGPRDVKFVGRLVRQNGAPVTVDRVGSVVANPLNRYARYSGPYGDKIAETVNNPVYPGNFEFASYLFDVSTGFHYADQRFYSSTYARFVSADPYIASAGAEDPGSLNRYSYTRGDPVNRYDPLGLADFYVDGICGAGCQDVTGNGGYSRGSNGGNNENTPQFEVDTGDQRGGTGGPPLQNRDLLGNAVRRAVAALANESCAGLFGNQKTRNGKFDPTIVLSALADGTKFGSIKFADKSTSWGVAQVTPNGLPCLASKATITINSTVSPGYWNSNNVDQNALTLLHELGHVYDLIRGSGGSAIKSPDALLGGSRSEYNDWLVDQNCFNGSLGYKLP